LKQKILYLHAGGSKTGSSALQNFFASHIEELETLDFSYKNSVDLQHDYEITSGNGLALFEYLIKSPSEKGIQEHILEFFGDCGHAIISSEHLQHLNAQQITLLSTATASLNIKLDIIFFVRNLNNFFVSAYDQLIKRHGECQTIDKWLLSVNIYEHTCFLRAATQVLSPTQLHVIHYDSVSNNLIGTMLKTLGLNERLIPEDNINQKIINRSLTHIERELMIVVNKTLGQQYSTELSDLLINQSPDLVAEPRTLSKASINLLKTRFQNDVDWVNKQFFNDKPVLAIEALNVNSQKQHKTRKNSSIDASRTILNWALEKISSAREEGQDFILNALINAANSDSVSRNNNEPNDFNSVNYLILNPDVLYSGIDARQHWIDHGATEGRLYKLDLLAQDENSQTITVPVNIKAHPVSITIRIDVSAQD
jgi:hypothetical protein